jgi:hypothetical protein
MMACIGIIAASAMLILATDAMTLAWTHTVEGTRWEEDYVLSEGRLSIREARVKRSGAGMDPPEGAVWNGGWWRYVPSIPPLSSVTLANSRGLPGYTICWDGKCRPLHALVSAGDIVTIMPSPCVAP